jgi:phage gp36-like protein
LAYVTAAETIELYGEDYILSSVDRDKDGGADLDALNSALTKASNVIDSYLGSRYDVPISPTPEILKQYTIDIGLYYASPDLALTEEKRRRYEDAIAWLKLAAKGDVSLGIADPPADLQPHNVEFVSDDRLFTRSKMEGLF